MKITRKIGGVFNAPAAVTEQTVYTVPSNASALATIYYANITASAATLTITVTTGGTAVSIMTAKSIAANSANDTAPIRLMLGAGDIIKMTHGTTLAISAIVSVEETLPGSVV